SATQMTQATNSGHSAARSAGSSSAQRTGAPTTRSSSAPSPPEWPPLPAARCSSSTATRSPSSTSSAFMETTSSVTEALALNRSSNPLASGAARLVQRQTSALDDLACLASGGLDFLGRRSFVGTGEADKSRWGATVENQAASFGDHANVGRLQHRAASQRSGDRHAVSVVRDRGDVLVELSRQGGVGLELFGVRDTTEED